MNDLESEENNFSVPLLDEDCKIIINAEFFPRKNIESAHVGSNITLSKLKSQSDDKKGEFLRDIAEKNKENNKISKNSPVTLKKQVHVKIDEKFVNNHENTLRLKKNSIKQISSSKEVRYLGSSLISPDTSIKNINTTYQDGGFNSSSDSDKNIKKKIIHKTLIGHSENSFFKKFIPNINNNNQKQINSNSNLNLNSSIHYNILNGTANNPFSNNQAHISTNNQKYSNSYNNVFSKLELSLEKESLPSINTDPDRIVIVLKIKKLIWKNKKSIQIVKLEIKFDYNLKIDTVEKVVNEMKNQRQLNLNENETMIIMEKLTNFRI